MKKRNILLSILIAILLISGISVVVYRVLQDENAFNVVEKKYILDNKTNLISINVLNDSNVFGRDGKGVYYDFLKSFEEENGMSFNIVTASINTELGGLSLTKGSTIPKDAKLIYTDHYVLVSKTHKYISDIGDVKDIIGYLTKDESMISPYLDDYSLSLKNYDDRASLLEGLKNDEVSYILVPRLEYIDSILDGLYTIDYHFSNLKDYYYMLPSENETLTSILSKYFNKWNEDKFKESFNKNEFETFTEKLKITQKELDVINRKTYTYGFIKNEPYDVKIGGEYGGVISRYITEFSEFSGISFDYKEYSKYDKLSKAISKGDVDIFVNYSGLDTEMATIESSYLIDISIVQSNKDERTFTDVKSLNGQTVYVKDNSLIKKYLEDKQLNIQLYSSDKELDKIFKENGIVAMDYAKYLIYNKENKNVNERFRINTTTPLVFQSDNDTMFNRLYSYYINSLDKNEVIYTGIYDYDKTKASGSLIYNITKYAILLIAIIGIVVFISYKLGKKVLVKKKIKRGDKMKYIDILTSLKNRNYLNENISIWNQNTIYPQAVILLDLNRIQEINDSYGYAEGDKQIQAVANVLIKTQLDNSEIMRTDGNEFTIYMVGYNEKQVLSYIKKLTKEFKNLPYEHEAAIGFSMIEDDVKLIGDAINEATEKMKENKALKLEEQEDEKI